MSEASIDNRETGSSGANTMWSRGPMLAAFLAIVLAGTVGALAYTVGRGGDPYMIIGLGVLALIGLFALFAALAGLITLSGAEKADPLMALVLDQAEEACAVTDKAGTVIYANDAYRRLARVPGASGPSTIETLYAGHPEIAEQIYRVVQAGYAGTPHTEPVRLAPGSSAAGAREDHPVWLKISATPLRDAGQASTVWRVADVSEEREEQEGAFVQLQHIIDYLDHAPAGFFSADSAGRVQYLNATLAGWLNIDLGVTTGGTLSLADVLGADGARMVRQVEGAAGATAIESLDMTLRGGDGRALPVRVIHRAVFDAGGAVQASQSLVLDHRVESMPEISGGKTEKRFARFFNSAPIGIALLTGDGEIVNANAGFMRVVGKAAKRGRPLASFIAEDERERLAEALERAQSAAGPGVPVDVTFAGDEERPGEIHLSPLEEGDDEAGLIAYAFDRSEQRALEQQFTQSQKMQAIGQLASGVAHDFNNMLTAIIGDSDLLLMRHRPTDPSFHEIMNIKQSANRAANLVRHLLAFSRQQTLRPEVFSLKEAIAELANLLKRLLGEKIELKTDLGTDIWTVKADYNQFEQVIINLSVNARDAMGDGGTLTIRTANVSKTESAVIHPDVMPAGEYVLCEIADTGTGMPPEVLAKIYEPFFTTKEVGKGTGLGLSSVYGIVKQTGGFIFCDSKPGKGTAFQIYLPRHDKAPEPIAAAEEEGKAPAPPAKKDLTGAGTIMLVEDEDVVRASTSRALTSRGYTVIEATSGIHALEIIDQDKPEIDLVVSDVVMPEMDGPAMLEEFKSRGLGLKVIFMSGYAEDTFRKTLEENPNIAFLAKPFTIKDLAATVKTAMES